MLKPGGRIVITVPSPRVDDILHLLIRLHLIAGMSAHEHYGFKPAHTLGVFAAPRFRVLKKARFQLGLNNLFVFEKAPRGDGQRLAQPRRAEHEAVERQELDHRRGRQADDGRGDIGHERLGQCERDKVDDQ